MFCFPRTKEEDEKREREIEKNRRLTCLRFPHSWLPLLFIPTTASPAFIFLFFVSTYFLNRPCVYCSILLLILFCTSCNWSDRCFFDFSSDWFRPRPSILTSPSADGISSIHGANGTLLLSDADDFNSTVVQMLNTTTKALAGAAASGLQSKTEEWTGLGVGWLRSLLGRREWSIDCMDIKIRL